MEFSVIINKQANFYFFVQNLSEWHFSCRKNYNIFWKEKLGQLSLSEKEALKDFKNLQAKYSFGKNFFGEFFFISKSPLEKMQDQKEISNNEIEVLKKIFSIFSHRFNLIFEDDYKYLQKWKDILEKHINNKDLIQDFNSILSVLFNTKPLKKNIKIYLLLSSPNQCGGGANMDDESITLEISRYSTEKINQIAGIIWHELVHLYFQQDYLMPLLGSKNLDQETINLVKEAAVSSLLPNGILGKDFLKVNAPLLNVKIPANYNKFILNTTNEYVKNKKPFDDNYIKNIISGLADLKGILR